MGGHTLGLATPEDLYVAQRRTGLALTRIAYTGGLLQGMVYMALSKHGQLLYPEKSPYNFESYDSLMELHYMQRMEIDPFVRHWMKRHTITIPWIDAQKHQRRYHPDFLVEYATAPKHWLR